jgi:hypothetical protein
MSTIYMYSTAGRVASIGWITLPALLVCCDNTRSVGDAAGGDDAVSLVSDGSSQNLSDNDLPEGDMAPHKDGSLSFVCGSAESCENGSYCRIGYCSEGKNVLDGGNCPPGCELAIHPTYGSGPGIPICATHACVPHGCSSCGCLLPTTPYECGPVCRERSPGALYWFPGLCGPPTP